jgi:hypothetical protein
MLLFLPTLQNSLITIKITEEKKNEQNYKLFEQIIKN